MASLKKIIFFAILSVIGYLLFQYDEAITLALREHPLLLALVIVTTIINIHLQAYNFGQLLGPTPMPPLPQTVRMWSLASLSNYLGPFQPGIALRLAFFKLHGITLKASSSATFRQALLNVKVALVLIFLASLMIEELPWLFSLAALIVLILWPLMINQASSLLSQPWLSSRISAEALSAIINAFKHLQGSRQWPFYLQYLLVTLNILVIYNGFGTQLEFADALLLATLVTLTSLLSITPSNIGIQEALLGYAAHLHGLDMEQIIAIALLFRLGHICACSITYTALQLAYTTTKPR